MKKPKAIESSLEFIERQLTGDINISVLAEQAFFSKTHYQRLFRAIVGEPVMEYIKNRRLQLACRDILIGDVGILDIALKYGYDSHEGFTRAFKAYFGAPPSEYRKRGKSNETEVMKMLSNDVLNRIGQNAEKISAALTNFIEEAEKLTALAYKTAESAGAKGTTTKIVANELSHLAKRAECFRDENVKNLAVCGASAFEMFSKIFGMIKCLDDVVFQMNLLRFFCGIETGRISPPKDEFDMLDAEYGKLCSKIVDNKEYMITLINEAVELLHEDIKQEAENCLKSSIKVVNKAVEEGKSTAASAYAAAESLGERGRAFSYIAKEVSASIDVLNNVTDDFNNINDLSNALPLLINTAFGMNINAFNAAVETARAGNTTECLSAADKIMKYAGILHKTYNECENLSGEYKRLIDLTQWNGKQSEQDFTEKHVDDIVFQSKILSTQFALEAERTSLDVFRTLAQTAITIHAQLAKTRNVAQCRKAVAKFLQELDTEVSALENGGSFAYFAKEYTYFLKRI